MTEDTISAKGVIMHDKEIVANLKIVGFNIEGAFAGQPDFEPDTEKLHTNKVLHGTIIDGEFTTEALKHYSTQDIETEWFKRNLTTTETIVLETEDGKEITIKNIRFDSDITKDNKLSFIENVKFCSPCFTMGK